VKPRINALFRSRPVWAWALYDWANSAFATTVLAGFFPLFFKDYWSGTDASVSTFQLGAANAASSLLIVVAAPLLGALADVSGRRKTLLALFSVAGMLLTAGLFWVGQGQWAAALILFTGATVGFMGANVFYDALIVTIKEEQRDLASAFGFALGYLGGGILFSVNVAMALAPAWFGFADAAAAIHAAFLSVAAWWALFSLPLLFSLKETPAKRPLGRAFTEAAREVLRTLGAIRSHRVAFLFLLAYWFYIDGVDTIIRMAVDYGRALGFGANDLIVALLITQFIGFPAALAFGFIAGRWGAKNGLTLGLCVYVGVTVWAYFMREVWEFYLLAVVVGLVQGGVQALSRSLYSRLVPVERCAEFFGFYNMLGKSAALIGPLLVGLVTLLSDDHRLGILSIILLLAIGIVLLRRIDFPRGH
jgi:UMF1 family MFS transporter